MTLGDIIRHSLTNAPLQFLHECLLGARDVNRRGSKGAKKGHEPYTRVEFATTNMTCNDAFYWGGGFKGAPADRRPKYVGVIVWIPRDDYDRLSGKDNPPNIPYADERRIRKELEAGVGSFVDRDVRFLVDVIDGVREALRIAIPDPPSTAAPPPDASDAQAPDSPSRRRV